MSYNLPIVHISFDNHGLYIAHLYEQKNIRIIYRLWKQCFSYNLEILIQYNN